MELWKWWIPNELKPGKLKQSWRMGEAEAQARFPGSRRVDGSQLVVTGNRELPTADQAPGALIANEHGVKVPRGPV